MKYIAKAVATIAICGTAAYVNGENGVALAVIGLIILWNWI